mgnify:CR=1 FL=1
MYNRFRNTGILLGDPALLPLFGEELNSAVDDLASGAILWCRRRFRRPGMLLGCHGCKGEGWAGLQAATVCTLAGGSWSQAWERVGMSRGQGEQRAASRTSPGILYMDASRVPFRGWGEGRGARQGEAGP